MRIQFNNSIDQGKFHYIIALECLKEIAKKPDFWDRVKDRPFFDYSTISGEKLAEIMQLWLTGNLVKIGFYNSSWFFRGVVAHVPAKNPLLLNFNTRHWDFSKIKGETLEQDIATKINTVAHELVHVADNFSGTEASFGHGDNRPDGKEFSFPYWFGRHAETFFIESIIRGRVERYKQLEGLLYVQ